MNFFKSTAGRWAVLALAYLAMALVMTYPLALHLGSFAAAGLEDGAMSVWNLWWLKFSLFGPGENFLYTGYLFYPEGASLTFHSIPKLLGLASIPLQYLVGVTAAYNIVVLLTFVLTGLATYLLAFHFLGERLPAFLASAFFAFSAIRWDHLGHLQLLATILIPVYILLIIRGKESLAGGGGRPWIYFSLAGLALAMTAYDTEYYAVLLIIFSGFYFLFNIPLERSPAAFRRWGLLLLGIMASGAVFVALFSPMLLAAAGERAARGDYFSFPASWAHLYAREFLSFFVPSQHSEFFGSAFSRFRGRNIENTFLGWLPVLLAIGAAWRFRRQRGLWLWAMAAVMFALLALGPNLSFGHRIITHYGPYLIITKIPIINTVRVPARFSIITMLAVAILAGYGASALFGYLRRRSRDRNWAGLAVPAATALLLLGIFIEYKPLLQMTSTTAPPVYSEIAASEQPGSVITLPLGWEAGAHVTGIERTYTQLFQLAHQRPMVGGMLARAPKELLFEGLYTPVLAFLANPVDLEPSELDRDPEAIARFRERYRVSFIVAHKTSPEVYYNRAFLRFPSELTPEALERVDAFVTGYLDMEKFAETDEIVAYRRR
ncbi:MAG: hypothetical protein IBX61_02245 [Thermoleophilia bacterium]|nr:hypothetical protein [Thermoleophilia bacterium]